MKMMSELYQPDSSLNQTPADVQRSSFGKKDSTSTFKSKISKKINLSQIDAKTLKKEKVTVDYSNF